MADAKFIRLTDLAGNAVWLGVAWIQLVVLPYKNEAGAGANAVVVLSGEKQAVRETVDEVMALLNEHK